MRVLVQNLCTPWLGALPNKTDRMNEFFKHVDSYDVLLLQELFTFWLPFGYSLGNHREWFSERLFEKGFFTYISLRLFLSGKTVGWLLPVENQC